MRGVAGKGAWGARQGDAGEGPPGLGESEPRRLTARRRSGPPNEWQQWVMGWTPPDGIYVPKWRCQTATEGGVRGAG